MKKQNKNFHPQAFLEPFLLNIQDFFLFFLVAPLKGAFHFGTDQLTGLSINRSHIIKSANLADLRHNPVTVLQGFS